MVTVFDMLDGGCYILSANTAAPLCVYMSVYTYVEKYENVTIANRNSTQYVHL